MNAHLTPKMRYIAFLILEDITEVRTTYVDTHRCKRREWLTSCLYLNK